jgi:hypothetical protein
MPTSSFVHDQRRGMVSRNRSTWRLKLLTSAIRLPCRPLAGAEADGLGRVVHRCQNPSRLRVGIDT